jgi:hypothetical protein
MEFKKYFPYVSIDRPSKKFFIITNDNKKVYFGNLVMNISQKDI